jgi:2-polyprenyl-3-methyl-5-hydroxy-6-metoxy-1,4-benzoquinol methylase
LTVWGVEPVGTAAERARVHLDKVVNSNIEQAMPGLPDGAFDCITFNDCLEHLVDPWAVLRCISQKLAHGGCVIASIPNLRFYPVMRGLIFQGDFTYTDQGVLDRTHLRFFTQSGVRAIFAECGYEITAMKGIRGTELPFWLKTLSRICRWRFHDMDVSQFALVAKPV